MQSIEELFKALKPVQDRLPRLKPEPKIQVTKILQMETESDIQLYERPICPRSATSDNCFAS